MATYYNYNNGYYTTGNQQFGYTNGNFSTQTNIVNGVAYTRNIVNAGNNCSGNNNCIDGYSLYFPCIKDITRGQNVCFDFFIGDNANKDELDMRDLDAMTLQLSGRFGCTYKSYTYPEDIVSLQKENYREIFNEDFGFFGKNMCLLTMKYFDENLNDVEPNVSGKIGVFRKGSHVKLTADDTPTHIFVGWGKYNSVLFDSDCDVVSIDDLIVSTSKVYEFDITEDTELYAIYRLRRQYKICIDEENKHSHFEIIIDNTRYFISNKKRDFVYVPEGYHFTVTCLPNRAILDGSNFYYSFMEWKDGYNYQNRELVADEENVFFNNGIISLCAKCVETSNELNYINDLDEVKNHFEYAYPTDNVIYEDIDIMDFNNYDEIMESNGVVRYYSGKNGYLLFDNGNIKTSPMNVSDGIKIEISGVVLEDSAIIFEVNGEEKRYSHLDFDDYEFEIECSSDMSDSDMSDSNGSSDYIMKFKLSTLFRKCNYSSINIRTEGKMLIDKIIIYEEIIEDKGLARLCIPPEDTAEMHAGPLFVSGAISVGGNTFGINQTLIGNINNLKTINLV